MGDISMMQPHSKKRYFVDDGKIGVDRVRELVTSRTLGTAPVFISVDGTPVVLYRSVRLTFKRDVIERLPPDGLIVIRVERGSANALAVAISRRHFESQFENVWRSKSWETRGSYDFAKLPNRILPFVVDLGESDREIHTDSEESIGHLESRDTDWTAPR